MAYTYSYQYTPPDQSQSEDALKRYMQTRERMLGAYTAGQRANKLAVAGEADRLAKEQFAQDTNIQSDTLKGAAIGSSVLPGWGTLAGVVIGGAVGMKGAYDARKKKGQNTWKAGWDTFKDSANPLTVGKQLLGAVQQNPGGAASVASAAGRGLAKRETARGPAPSSTAGSQAVQDYYGRLQQLQPASGPAMTVNTGTTTPSLSATPSYSQYQGDLAATQQTGPMYWDAVTNTWRYRGE
jgi:hypothetical protein